MEKALITPQYVRVKLMHYTRSFISPAWRGSQTLSLAILFCLLLLLLRAPSFSVKFMQYLFFYAPPSSPPYPHSLGVRRALSSFLFLRHLGLPLSTSSLRRSLTLTTKSTFLALHCHDEEAMGHFSPIPSPFSLAFRARESARVQIFLTAKREKGSARDFGGNGA